MAATKMGIDPPEMRYATVVVAAPIAATPRSVLKDSLLRGSDPRVRAAPLRVCAGGPGGSVVIIPSLSRSNFWSPATGGPGAAV